MYREILGRMDVVKRILLTKFLNYRLRAVLREQLIKSGWRDSLKMECRRVVQEQGLDNISVDEIVKQVTPHARGKSHGKCVKTSFSSCMDRG